MDLHVYRNSPDRWHDLRAVARSQGSVLAVGAVTSIFTYGLSLLAAAALDWFLYYRLREVTVCYYCNSIYRGYTANPKHKGYDLSVGELVEGSIRGEQ